MRIKLEMKIKVRVVGNENNNMVEDKYKINI